MTHHASGPGVTLALIDTEPADRDPVPSEAAREAVLAAITMDEIEEAGEGRDRATKRAAALKAVLPASGLDLAPGERVLLSWGGSTGSPTPPDGE